MHHSLVPCQLETGPIFWRPRHSEALEQSIQCQAYDGNYDAGRGPERARLSAPHVKSYVHTHVA